MNRGQRVISSFLLGYVLGRFFGPLLSCSGTPEFTCLRRFESRTCFSQDPPAPRLGTLLEAGRTLIIGVNRTSSLSDSSSSIIQLSHRRLESPGRGSIDASGIWARESKRRDKFRRSTQKSRGTDSKYNGVYTDESSSDSFPWALRYTERISICQVSSSTLLASGTGWHFTVELKKMRFANESASKITTVFRGSHPVEKSMNISH